MKYLLHYVQSSIVEKYKFIEVADILLISDTILSEVESSFDDEDNSKRSVFKFKWFVSSTVPCILALF